MKNKKFTVVLVILLAVTGIVAYSAHSHYVAASDEIVLIVTTPKKTFQLGEIVPIEVKITNNAATPIYLKGSSYIKTAFKEDKEYKLYAPQGPSISFDATDVPIKINPQESLNIRSTILWNEKPRVSHLNPDAAKPFLEGRMLTDYAFPESGIYYIKAYINVSKDGQVKTLESTPNKITIEESVGKDLEVWNKIKSNGDFAYFIQEGDIRIPAYKSEERAKFLQEIEKILTDYPDSFYAESLRQSLDKFRASEAKRQEFLQKIQNQKEKPQ